MRERERGREREKKKMFGESETRKEEKEREEHDEEGEIKDERWEIMRHQRFVKKYIVSFSFTNFPDNFGQKEF